MSDSFLHILWDHDDDAEGNVQHILENGVTPDEVRHLFENYESTDHSTSSGHPMVFGYLPDGRYVTVVYEEIDEFPWTVYPITAYEVPEPR